MANGDDAALNELAALVRATFAAPLARIQATAAVEGGGCDAASACDTLVPPLRKTPSTTNSSSAPVVADASAWKRVLLMVFRRYADHLVVRGKLLNQEELLVSQFCRVDARGRPQPVCVRIPESLALRFVLPCDDGPVARVGHNDVVARVTRTQAYPGGSSSADVSAVVVMEPSDSSNSHRHHEREQSFPAVSPSLWEEPCLLTDLDTLYGFDVRALLQANGHQMIARLAADNDDAANAVISRTPAFSDLRCTKVMMQNYGIQTTTGFESFAMDPATKFLCAGEAHPRSYISLGKAQKRCWADERLTFGKELVAKGRLKDALVEFSSCLKLEEEHTEALFARGEALVALQHLPDAIRDFEAVRRVDVAFPGLDAALLRARGKLKHSRHVELPSSLPDKREFVSAAAEREREGQQLSSAYKSRSGSNVDTRAQDNTSRSRSRSRSSLYKAADADPVPVRAADSRKLERDRLRRLLEEEVRAKDTKEKRRSHRKRSSRARSSSEDEESDDSEHSTKKRKHSSKKKKRKKHDKHKKKSSKTHRKHKRRSSSDDDRSSDSESSSSSSVRFRRKKSSSSSKNKREESSRAPSREAEPEEPLHPILQRQRHRIWN